MPGAPDRDLRAPLPVDAAAWSAVLGPQAFREVRVLPEVPSTNAALAALADRGEPAGLVLVAERQTAGRGRLGRSWSSPDGAGLTFSVLLRPDVAPSRLGWLPLLAGLAVADAVAGLASGADADVRPRLKWPNDVVVDDRKLAGVLAERRPPDRSGAPPAVVLGVGLNVGTRTDELPVAHATSLSLEAGRGFDRAAVLVAVLDELAARYRSWTDAGGDADACGLRPAYVVRCATVGRRVRIELPGGTVEGEALGIDPDGALRLADAADLGGTIRTLHAGDVVHLR